MEIGFSSMKRGLTPPKLKVGIGQNYLMLGRGDRCSLWCNGVNTLLWCSARTILRRHGLSVAVVVAININICPTRTINNICRTPQAYNNCKLFHVSSTSGIATPLYWLLKLQIWFRNDEELYEELVNTYLFRKTKCINVVYVRQELWKTARSSHRQIKRRTIRALANLYTLKQWHSSKLS